VKGLIADIQRASIHDGSGIRTTVFFKGCPLRCEWCHNPECISFEQQTMFYPKKCIQCGMCEKGCYSGAKVVCGKEYSKEGLLKEIMLDRDYYGEEGGVTFSGGEPLAQKEFLNEIIDLCHKEHIGCAVETSLIYYDEELLKKLDFVMADLKIWDDTIHKQYTGVSNRRIKEHFGLLNKLGVPIIARTPVIPEISQGIDKISEFLKQFNNVKRYELLPYHSLGISKQMALGMEIKRFKMPSKDYMKELEHYAYIR
jgi:pyruvate formate lyase activating enzyme